MKKFLSLTLLILSLKFITAQVEQLHNLSYNPALYYSTKSIQPARHALKYLIDKGNTIVTTDTLTLPFVDDFSTNRLRSYKWVENHITDTVYNVIGACLGYEGVTTVNQTFSEDTAWTYTFNATDTNNIHFDSTALPSIKFYSYGVNTANCLSDTAPAVEYFWPQYYSYSYDTATRTIDSTLVTDSTTNFDYAPVIYFAQGEPGTLWFDNYAYVNNTYPINPPTIGVATLDGLNQFGLPYDNSSNTTYGDADYLTSKPINLSGLNFSDNVYLSFFFEPQGLGDFPDPLDSLMVDFKDVSGQWQTMWSDTGYSSVIYVPDTFQQVLIQIPDMPLQSSFFHNTFQFRFHNKASLYGNNDHWHIDYVRLDKNRFAGDKKIKDIAFVYPFPSILKNYTLMPADQFNNPNDLRDTITLTVHNLDSAANNNPPATNFVKEAVEIYPSPVIIAPPLLQTFNAGDYSYIPVSPSAEYSVPLVNADSVVLLSTVTINPNDTRPQNDTLYHTQNFNSIMAYDDGSAEKAYGLFGLGLKKFAYEFNLNHPDTLAGFQFMFSQVDDNVSNLVFNFNVWDSIRLNDLSFNDDSTLIYSLENRTPYYIDSVNGYTTYKLDSPIVVSGKVYIGWSQTDTRNLQIGYDLNSTLGRKHMFIYTNARWDSSTITPFGSPMIRLILDSVFWGGTSAVHNLVEDNNNIRFFPNPTTGIIRIQSEKNNTELEIAVLNMMGQVVKYTNNVTNQLDISELQTGIYLLSARDIKTGKSYHSKIIKTDF